MILRGYCTYLHDPPMGPIARKKQMYYRENPDAWAAETQDDMLWLTEEETLSLLPGKHRVGSTLHVPLPIQQRFYSTIGIEYMEGSVNALPTTDSLMTIRVKQVNSREIHLILRGSAQMGVPFAQHDRNGARSRGCELTLAGELTIDRTSNRYSRFDLVGIGRAWGNKMDSTRKAIRIAEYPWAYGIACELITTRNPVDLIPPYNLVHYGSGLSYFGKSR